MEAAKLVEKSEGEGCHLFVVGRIRVKGPRRFDDE
jgi:hypothetical protein